MTTTYADPSELSTLLAGTDGGTGTPAQLSPAQLQQAITFGSNRVSLYAGAVFDSSTPQAIPPDSFHDLTLDIAAFFAWTTYMKSKALTPQHPVMLRYLDAMNILNAVRDGKLRLDVVPPGGAGDSGGTIINRIPRIFSPDDSNTRYDPVTGYLEPQGGPMSGANWSDFGSGFIYP
jgi:hypothetical protein